MDNKGNHFRNISEMYSYLQKSIRRIREKCWLLKEINNIKKSINVLTSVFDSKNSVDYCHICYVKPQNNVLYPVVMYFVKRVALKYQDAQYVKNT